jgi:hypothetical protein
MYLQMWVIFKMVRKGSWERRAVLPLLKSLLIETKIIGGSSE